jgi:hypothetical protein
VAAPFLAAVDLFADFLALVAAPFLAAVDLFADFLLAVDFFLAVAFFATGTDSPPSMKVKIECGNLCAMLSPIVACRATICKQQGAEQGIVRPPDGYWWISMSDTGRLGRGGDELQIEMVDSVL